MRLGPPHHRHSGAPAVPQEEIGKREPLASAHTLGPSSYIAAATDAGDYPRIVLGIAVMSVFVTVFNRLVWRPLYAYAERDCAFSAERVHELCALSSI